MPNSAMDTKLGLPLLALHGKTIMIQRDRRKKISSSWTLLLEEFQVNMRHAANDYETSR
jgi:hypothetical protein